jgi:cytochrome c oxidase subunit 2
VNCLTTTCNSESLGGRLLEFYLNFALKTLRVGTSRLINQPHQATTLNRMPTDTVSPQTPASSPPLIGRIPRMAVAIFKLRHAPIGLALLALFGLLAIAGCTPDHPQSTFDADGPVARRQLTLFVVLFWVVLFVGITVSGGLLYTVIRYRRRPGQGIPAQVHGNTRLEMAWTIIPALLLAAVAVPTIITQFYISNPPSGERLDIDVVAHQWWWEVKYPDSGVVTANEIHVPVDMTVNVNLISKDVIHSFWVPKLAGKMDILPGNETSLWFKADQVGEYFGQCAEFCGQSHTWMKFRVIVDTPEDFEAWKESQLASAAAPSTQAETEGAALFLSKACVMCHSITPGVGTAGFPYPAPNLAHLGSRTTLAAGTLDMTTDSLREWLADPNRVKPGNIMSKVAPAYTTPALAMTENEIDALAAYLQSLK